MKIQFDQNHLLTIFNENIPQTKEYTYNVGGYIFSDFDKGLVVLHKKDFKITNLKNLGDNMNVVYHNKEVRTFHKLETKNIDKALCLFKGFDEISGTVYNYIPGYSEKEINETNQILKKIGTEAHLEKTEKGCIVKGNSEARLFSTRIKYLNNGNDADPVFFTNEDVINILFTLTILYGKFEHKERTLNSIKIHIPISLGENEIMEDFDKLINQIKTTGIFLITNRIEKNNGTIYQISSNDYELLEIFAKWYEPVEKFEKISKREFTDEMKNKLIEFIETNPEIPTDGKDEVLQQIKNDTIKFLMK